MDYKNLSQTEKILYNAVLDMLIRHDKKEIKNIIMVLNKWVGLE